MKVVLLFITFLAALLVIAFGAPSEDQKTTRGLALPGFTGGIGSELLHKILPDEHFVHLPSLIPGIPGLPVYRPVANMLIAPWKAMFGIDFETTTNKPPVKKHKPSPSSDKDHVESAPGLDPAPALDAAPASEPAQAPRASKPSTSQSQLERVVSAPHPEPKTDDSADFTCGKQARGHHQNLFKFKDGAWHPSTDNRIIGGDVAKEHSWPWHVLLQKVNGDEFICGASLIQTEDGKKESDVIATAAHCVAYSYNGMVVYYNEEDFDAFAGIHDASKRHEDGRQHRKIKKFHKHPGFNPETLNNDIALVKLESPIPFNDTIRPICLPTNIKDIAPGGKCVATGFGRTKRNDTNSISTVLKQLKVEVHPGGICANNSRGGWGDVYVESSMICAGSLDGRESTCTHDAGGPLQCLNDENKWTLYGTVSFGADETCLTPGKPTIFARVKSYETWIAETLPRLALV